MTLPLQYSSIMAANSAPSKPDTEKSKDFIIRTHDAIFGQHFIDYEVYSEGEVTWPQNWDELLGMMEQPRLVVIPPGSYDAQYKAFRKAKKEALNEHEAMRRIFPLIVGNFTIYSSEGHDLGDLEDPTDSSIVKVTPEIYDGSILTTLTEEY